MRHRSAIWALLLVAALPAQKASVHLDERVRVVLDVSCSKAERVRRNHECERAMSAYAATAEREVLVDVAVEPDRLVGLLERTEMRGQPRDGLPERVGRMDADSAGDVETHPPGLGGQGGLLELVECDVPGKFGAEIGRRRVHE